MSRSETFFYSALQALLVCVSGLGALLLPMSLIWLVENDPTVPWPVTFKTAADIWLAGHGVSIDFAAGTLLGSKVPAFSFAFLPLGLSLLLGFAVYRIGRKLASAPLAWPGWLGALLTYGGSAFLLSALTSSESVSSNNLLALATVLAFVAVALFLGTFTGNPIEIAQIGIESVERQTLQAWGRIRFNNFGWAIRALAGPALRAGTGAVAILLLVSALAQAALVAGNWILITQLYEGIRVTALGGIMVTAGQLAILPNLAIYGATWFVGTGFSIGSGSLISPLGTAVGPMPALPILGALPIGTASIGLIALAVPLVGGFIATLSIRRLADQIRFEFASAWSAALSLGLSVAAVAAVEMGILVALASGAVGPGRLSEVGANPWSVAATVFIETAAVSVLAAFLSARPDAPDHDLLKKVKR